VLPLAAVVAFNLWTTYRNATATADLLTDRTLLASARVIAERIRETDGVLEAPIPPSALEMFASGTPDRVLYRVTTPSGILIAGDPDVLAPPQAPKGLEPLYFNAAFRGRTVRAVAIAQPIIAPVNGGNALVAVGQTLQGHDQLVTGLWLKALRDQALLIVAAGILALFGLRRGLAPLISLRKEVVERDPSVLAPFDTAAVQTELRPVVDALNEAFARIQQGTYASSFVAELIGYLRGQRIRSVGQSSWGPATFAVVEADKAALVAQNLKERFGLQDAEVIVTQAANRGATFLPLVA
jgi:two-component system sensor histidine kinase TctE